MRASSFLPLLACLLAPAVLAAQNDVAGSSDHRLFPRIAGYNITSFSDADPVIEEFRNGRDLDRDTIEGRVTSIAYELPGGGAQQATTSLGLVRYYEGIVQRLGGTVLQRAPASGEMTGRLVQNGREFWLRMHVENTHLYVIAIAERSAPAREAALAVAAGPGAASALLPQMARRFRAASVRFARDTSWVPVVQPARGMTNAIVAVRGLHVEDATEVRFGSTPGRILDRTASLITVVVPSRSAGMVPVVVSGPAGARTARDSFLLYQEPMHDGSNELRVYTCTDPPRPGVPTVTRLAPMAVRTGDTLAIEGTMLDEVDYVSFTFHVSGRRLGVMRDRNWGATDADDPFSGYPPSPDAGRGRILSLPVTQTATRLTVVVPSLARSGPVALFGYGSCILSEQALGVRMGPAPM